MSWPLCACIRESTWDSCLRVCCVLWVWSILPLDVVTVLQLNERAGAGTPGVQGKKEEHFDLSFGHSCYLTLKSWKSVQPIPQKTRNCPFVLWFLYVQSLQCPSFNCKQSYQIQSRLHSIWKFHNTHSKLQSLLIQPRINFWPWHSLKTTQFNRLSESSKKGV